MINRKSIVNSPDDRLRQFNRMPIPTIHSKNLPCRGYTCRVYFTAGASTQPKRAFTAIRKMTMNTEL